MVILGVTRVLLVFGVSLRLFGNQNLKKTRFQNQKNSTKFLKKKLGKFFFDFSSDIFFVLLIHLSTKPVFHFTYFIMTFG